MTFFDAIVYGAVQGITEYLPISSSAHLILLPRFLGQNDPGLAFDVFLHAGTLASTLIYFWKDWKILLAGIPGIGRWFDRRAVDRDHHGVSREMWKWVALATLPALIAGALFHRVVEESLRGNSILATTLCGGGVLLWVLDRYSSAKKSLSALHFKDALAVGFGQCLALVPGMSRSGSTMMVARALGYSRESSARFSFLLSAPITAAALIFELRKWNEVIASVDSMSVIFAGACSAFIFGWIAIDGLLRLVKRFGYLSFAIYRFLLAAIIMTVLG